MDLSSRPAGIFNLAARHCQHAGRRARLQDSSGLAPGLEAAVNFETSSLTYGIGAHTVELEVDPLTCGVRLLNYVVVNDCGCIVNPMTAEGQIHGGAVHGIGNALFEWMGFDANASL